MSTKTSEKSKWFYLMLFGVALTLFAILSAHAQDHTLWSPAPVNFADPAGDTLVGQYYPGEIEAGVLLLEGFGSDQVNMRSAASEFARLGYHILTFDFSGHGRSPGTLGYDNAETDRLANQALAAKEQFKALSGLTDERILLLGHSLGARVALQAATMDSSMAGLILLGTQVNLSTNIQAEFFTGVSDSELDWVQNLGPENPVTNIILISGEWDDILTPVAAGLLAEKLSGKTLAPNSGVGHFEDRTRRDLIILPRLLHNFEPFSPRVLADAKYWGAFALGLPLPPAETPTAANRIGCWIIGFIGLLTSLIGGAGWQKSTAVQIPLTNIHITSMKRFLTAKLFLWFGALPLGAILAGIFFFLPIGLPTFNLIYVAFFGGYGVLMWLLYRFGRMPGTQGRLPFGDSTTANRDGVISAILVTILLLIITAAYARTGWIYIYPLNMRVLWLVLFALPTALGFWIGIYEIGIIAQVAPGKAQPQIGALLIGILPFFLYTTFLASIGSLSGVVSGVQGLLILGLALTFGYLLRQLTRVYWLVAVCQALLLYWLILPQGVLFG